jgi:hypothetical protein
MFRRGKAKKKGPVANTLSAEAEPNKLTWAAADAEAAELELADDEFPDDEDLEEEDEAGEEAEVDERTLAQRQADLQAELDRQAEEFGLTGSNPSAIYGPRGEDVVAVLDALSDIDEDRAERLADAWTAVDPTEREVLERDLLQRSRHGQRGYELSSAEGSVTAWLNSLKLEDDDEAALWTIVADAARGAVQAIVLDEDLDDADYDMLYGPWGEVMDADEGDEGGDSGNDAAGASDTEEAAEPQGDYGPNTELVQRFLARLGQLTPEKSAELAAAWKEQPKEDLRLAHRAVKELVREDQTWRDQVKAAQDRVAAWVDGPHPSPALRLGRNPVGAEAWAPALPAAVDAVSALVLADLLEQEDAESLYAAWEAAIGEPKLPEFEDDAR